MPRRKLGRKKTEMIQVMVEPRVKIAFDTWCAANSTTMSEVLRSCMRPYVQKGEEIMSEVRPETF